MQIHLVCCLFPKKKGGGTSRKNQEPIIQHPIINFSICILDLFPQTLQMGIQHFSGLFVLLCIGVGGALLTLAGEHTFYHLVIPRLRRSHTLQYWLHTSQVRKALTCMHACTLPHAESRSHSLSHMQLERSMQHKPPILLILMQTSYAPYCW